MLLKREIGPKIVANWSGRGGWFMASWERFLGGCRGFTSKVHRLQFRGWIAIILATIGPRSGHDRAAIGPRSGSGSFDDRLHFIVEAIPPRLLSDRSSIAPRSRFDRTAIVEFFHVVSAPSDRDPSDCDPHNHCAPRDPPLSARWRSGAPGDSTRVEWSRTIAAVRWWSDDRVVPPITKSFSRPMPIGAPRSATCRASKILLKRLFEHVFWCWSRGLRSTRSIVSIASRLDPTPAVPPRHLQGKNRVGT